MNWNTYVDGGRIPKEKRKRVLEGLAHVGRFIKAVSHEDDCPCHPDSGVRGQQCECGKVLAGEQVQAAARAIRRTRPR